MDEDLSNQRTRFQKPFQPLWRDILTLGKFEYILLSIDDLDCISFNQHANITSMKPSISIECYSSFIWLFVVLFENRRSFKQNLSSGIWLI